MVKSIDEKFLESGDLFGLWFNEGIVGLAVDTWQQTQFKPYSGVGSVSAQDDSGHQRLEHNGDDILFIESGEHEVYHVSIGQRPQSLRRYTRYPEGGANLRQIQNITTASSRNGDDYAYVDGNDSPYHNPTDAEELFIPPGFHLTFDFYNPNQNDSVDPLLNIRLRRYEVRLVDPNSEDGKNIMRRILSPGSPIPLANVGSPSQRQSIGDTKWNASALPESQINALMRQR